jgi:proline iminopeptidase
VTHYVRHNAWLEDGVLLREAGALAEIPGVLVHGRFDLQALLANAWELERVWPRGELVVFSDAGHAPGDDLTLELVRASDRFRQPA